MSVCSDDNDAKCSKLLRASLRGTSGSVSTGRHAVRSNNNNNDRNGSGLTWLATS